MVPLLGALIPLIGEVLDRVIPDTAGNEKAKREIEAALATAAMQGQLGQIEINKVEAAHKSLWTSGWRPFVGWVAASSMAFHFMVAPTVQWAGAIWGFDMPLPVFDMDALLYILGALLGIGGLRTFEKSKGLTK